MRIFGSARVTKTSAACRTSDVAARTAERDAAAMPDSPSMTALADLAQTDEMPALREAAPAYPAFAARVPTTPPGAPDVVESQTGTVPSEDGDSDVYVCRRSSPDLEEEAAAAAAAAAVVTLFVYGWESVEPGPLSWAFPSLRAALEAVRTMRNAVEWCIVQGTEWASIDAARAKGAVLVEQNG